jgi:hypothetical protein
MSALNRDTNRRRHMSMAIACTSLMVVVGGVFWIGASPRPRLRSG